MDNNPKTTANVNIQSQLAFEITWMTVFDTTNASIFFQSLSNLIQNEETKKKQYEIMQKDGTKAIKGKNKQITYIS